MSIVFPILVTSTAGRVGGAGVAVVEILRRRDLPVRALVHSEDERAESLRNYFLNQFFLSKPLRLPKYYTRSNLFQRFRVA